MSMDTCTVCGDVVDTDIVPEVYRAEFDNKLICENCIEEYEKEHSDEH